MQNKKARMHEPFCQYKQAFFVYKIRYKIGVDIFAGVLRPDPLGTCFSQIHFILPQRKLPFVLHVGINAAYSGTFLFIIAFRSGQVNTYCGHSARKRRPETRERHKEE